jgi:hypothetical protein
MDSLMGAGVRASGAAGAVRSASCAAAGGVAVALPLLPPARASAQLLGAGRSRTAACGACAARVKQHRFPGAPRAALRVLPPRRLPAAGHARTLVTPTLPSALAWRYLQVRALKRALLSACSAAAHKCLLAHLKLCPLTPLQAARTSAPEVATLAAASGLFSAPAVVLSR